MKLRIRNDTLRLRLTQHEVEQLGFGQAVTMRTHFPGAVLTCTLATTPDDTFGASLSDGTLEIGVPRRDACTWASSDQTAMTAELSSDQRPALTLLIEKDFRCRSPDPNRRPEDDDDTFEHPADASARP